MGITSWMEKNFAKGIAKAMKHSYDKCKVNMPEATEKEILQKTLSLRPSREARKIIEDRTFWAEKENINLQSVVLEVINREYRKGHLKNDFLSIPSDTMDNLMDGILEILKKE